MATRKTPLLLLVTLLLLLVTAVCGSDANDIKLRFQPSCSIVRFNYFYNKYEIKMKLNIENAKSASTVSLIVAADSAAASKQSGILLRMSKVSGDAAEVSILCDSFSRCSRLRDEVISNPSSVASALTFSIGNGYALSSQQLDGLVVSAALPQAGMVPARCNKGWIVFQQRVDGSLSFKQNWLTYERGFGNINGNYWMGLKNLHNMLQGAHYQPCKLRVEVQYKSGEKGWSEWNHFFVYGQEARYQVLVSSFARGKNIAKHSVGYMHGSKFSTYDKDNDVFRSGSCSKYYGYAGWWYKHCHRFNPNGVYPFGSLSGVVGNDRAVYSTIYYRKKFSALQKTKLMFRC